MSAAETGQMSAVETGQMHSIGTGQSPFSIVDICLVSTSDICPSSAADIRLVPLADICPVITVDTKAWLAEAAIAADEKVYMVSWTTQV